MSECQSIFGHNFEPRYDSFMPSGMSLEGGNIMALETMKTKTYVYDICTRCGEIVKSNPHS